MNEQGIIDFLKLVQKTLQTNYKDVYDAKPKMEKLLNVCDELHFKITGKKIIIREQSLIQSIASTNPLSVLPDKQSH